MAGALSRRRAGAADYTWPGYVDALTTLLMVLIFLLSIFSVAQFTLSTTLSSRESAIDILNQQVGTLASQLSLEKKSAEELQKDVARLTILANQLRADRDTVKAERDQLAVNVKELDTKSMDLQKETERQKLELTRLAAALAAANSEKGKLFSDLTEEQKQTAEQKANMVRLTAEMAALKDELARLNAALEAADVKAKEQNAQIVDLGQKLNRALASKVEELARYRSEFFGKLREALAGQRDVQIVGDRFVFQSEVLFPSGSAAAAAERREAAGERRPAADRDQLEDPQGHQLGAAGRRPHRQQADQHCGLPVQLGAVGGARHRRGEVPQQPGHRQRAPGGGGLWRVPAAVADGHCPQPAHRAQAHQPITILLAHDHASGGSAISEDEMQNEARAFVMVAGYLTICALATLMRPVRRALSSVS